jgi:putative GTP pyrophosphokinase
MDISEIVGQWEKDEPNYIELGTHVYAHIKKAIPEYEILPEISFRTKDLLSIVKKVKKKQSEKEYSYDHLNDKLGLRIICSYKEDLDKVDSFLRNNFIIKKAEYKKDILDFDKLDYTSNHYDASIRTDIGTFKTIAHLENLVFEIQVRTLNQHAWSNTAHSLAYKQEADIHPLLKRRVYRLLSLYEIADDEFSSVNQALSNNADNIVYSLLRKLEGKIYKYAKIDFDRTTSLINIKILLTYINIDQQQKLLKSIESFIKEKNDKITQFLN